MKIEDCNPDTLQPHIKDCPFCGHHPGPSYDTNIAGKWGFLVCNSCLAQGPEIRATYSDVDEWKQEAIDEWNNRS